MPSGKTLTTINENTLQSPVNNDSVQKEFVLEKDNTSDKSTSDETKIAKTENQIVYKEDTSFSDNIITTKDVVDLSPQLNSSSIVEKNNENNNTYDFDEDLSNSNKLFNRDLGEEIEKFNAQPLSVKKNQKLIVVPGKVEKNTPIKTGTIDVSAMKIKRNGDYVETDIAKQTDAIRINFKMFRNDKIPRGNKEVFIVIQNPKRKIINQKGTFTLRSGEEMPYTDETVVFFDSNKLNISITSSKFIQRFLKGTYIVSIYIERYLTAQTILILS